MYEWDSRTGGVFFSVLNNNMLHADVTITQSMSHTRETMYRLPLHGSAGELGGVKLSLGDK